jgi:hypothetical protein
VSTTLRPTAGSAQRLRATIEPHWRALGPGLVVVALMVIWAVANGGYDADTWYWGALVMLGLTAAVLAAGGWRRLLASRASLIAVGAFAAYVAWSYLSITWAQSQGDALQGSNRALLYLLVFMLMLALPWTAKGALAALLTFTIAVGVMALVILLRLASADHVSDLLADGRLGAPTGYFNSTVALFAIDALLAIVLAARRELPGLLRGLLIGIASASLQLAVIGQSRGWLFTLPIVIVVTMIVVRDRLRVVGAAVLPGLAALIPVQKLVAVYNSFPLSKLDHAASQAGRVGLMLCAATFVAGTLVAWAEMVAKPPSLSRRSRRMLGGVLTAGVIAMGFAGAVVATHGDPFGFLSRQWKGFSHPTTVAPTGSHFNTVGSARYDVWRVSLDAALAHPIGGLGQDNFDDYYVTRRRTSEEPSWTHSFEMRLLAHTGFVGFGLFAVFIAAALAGAVAARRRGAPLVAAAAGIAVVPFIDWLIHGSVDWFWEMPALAGPALGFLAVALALGRPMAPVGASATASPAGETAAASPVTARLRTGLPGPVARGLAIAGGALAVIGLALVLGFPYLSVREVALANDLRDTNPAAALSDLSHAASLDPLSAVPGRTGGTIALQSGRYIEAENRFQQSIDRERGGWYAWLGRGLAASALGDSDQARHDFTIAASINSRQQVVKAALARVDTTRPLTPSAALSMLVLVH